VAEVTDRQPGRNSFGW